MLTILFPVQLLKMPVPFLLLEVLENLSTDELNKFKWFLGLKILKGCDPILTSYLESPHRQDTVSKMMQSYGEENAVNMTVAILRQIKLNNAAEDLHKSHTGMQLIHIVLYIHIVAYLHYTSQDIYYF